MRHISIAFFVLVLIVAISTGAYFYNTSPYNIWINSKLDMALGHNACLPGWDLQNLSKAFKTTRKKDVEKILYANKLLSLELGAYLYSDRGTINGGGGRDTLGWGGGDILFGDHRYISMEILHSLAEKPFKVVVLTSGFAAAEDNTFEFNDNGKTSFDVYLDGCLEWGFPKRLHEPLGKDEPTYRWEISARDANGDNATVRITEKVTLHYISRKIINTWSRVINRYTK